MSGVEIKKYGALGWENFKWILDIKGRGAQTVNRQNSANLGIENKLWELRGKLCVQFEEAHRLEAKIKKNLEVLGYEGQGIVIKRKCPFV